MNEAENEKGKKKVMQYHNIDGVYSTYEYERQHSAIFPWSYGPTKILLCTETPRLSIEQTTTKKITKELLDMDYNNQSQYRKYAIYWITPKSAYNRKLSRSLSLPLRSTK